MMADPTRDARVSRQSVAMRSAQDDWEYDAPDQEHNEHWNPGRRHVKGQATLRGVGVSSFPLSCNNMHIAWPNSSHDSRLLINRYNGIA